VSNAHSPPVRLPIVLQHTIEFSLADQYLSYHTVKPSNQYRNPADRTCAEEIGEEPIHSNSNASRDRHIPTPTDNMPKDLPTEDDPCTSLSLRRDGHPRCKLKCNETDQSPRTALHPVPFQFTEEDEAPATVPETGAGEQSKIKMILGLLKK
jgi:hypothetical protein